MSIKDNRRDYRYDTLSRESLLEDPVDQFSLWMSQALEADIIDPTAMCIATVDSSGKPSQRMVLLKGFDQDGFVFYTNLLSRKATEISANPFVSLHFPWLSLDRQVIIGGRAESLPETDVRESFSSRPVSSKLAAWASKQSSSLDSRLELENQFSDVKQRFKSQDIPSPEFWGGYRVCPETFEFWQGGAHRLHDRFYFQREQDAWKISRLSP